MLAHSSGSIAPCRFEKITLTTSRRAQGWIHKACSMHTMLPSTSRAMTMQPGAAIAMPAARAMPRPKAPPVICRSSCGAACQLAVTPVLQVAHRAIRRFPLGRAGVKAAEAGHGAVTMVAFVKRIDELVEQADERGQAILEVLYDYAEGIAPEAG
jgi:hypothetical protein